MAGVIAPRALPGVLVLIIALAVTIVPVADARPKDRGNKQDKVVEETVPASDPAQSDVIYGDAAGAGVEEQLTAGNAGSSNERTLLDLDSDGDYIPDALDNCPSVQNPDQADADGDGSGDPCTVYQDTDGDTVPDTSDNCPNVSTSDFSDRDGDGLGDPCDKSPDGVEPEPEPMPELDGQGGGEETAPPPPENGENQDGREIERPGRSRSRVRDRTETSEAVITTGVDPAEEGIGGPPAQEEPSAEEPVHDDPYINEELIAEAVASGELDAPPEPPPAPQRAWDQEAGAGATGWDAIVKIDAGAEDDELTAMQPADEEPSGVESGMSRPEAGNRSSRSQDDSELDVQDSGSARGWVRAKLLLQEELQEDEPTDPSADDGASQNGRADDGEDRDRAAPVPVENGLVITGLEGTGDPSRSGARGTEADETTDGPAASDDSESLDAPSTTTRGREADRNGIVDTGGRRVQPAPTDGSRRDGSSRGAAARTTAGHRAPRRGAGTTEKKRRNRSGGEDGVSPSWESDRYFDGGAALNWSGDLEVVGTDDPDLYLTQRSGTGPGKRRGFGYSIPVAEAGVYMVRLYFAEPYWGAPGGPEGDEGRRVFSVTAEDETLLEDIDIFAEVGELTALVKQAEVDVQDGELNLNFIASEGEPIVAAVEVLQPVP